MRSNIKEYMSQVEMLGSIFSGKINGMDDIDVIISHLKKFWKDEEIVIFCGAATTNRIQHVLNSFKSEESLTYEMDTPTFSSLMCEGSFYRGGFTFHIIEKPKMGNKSLWICTSEDAKEMQSLIVTGE